MTARTRPAGPPRARVPRLSYFFPAHNEEANLEGLVAEALEALPALAERFEIIAVDDGSKDRTLEIAERLAAEHPDVVRVVHHEVNRGYGGALRSGFEASRYRAPRVHGRRPPVPGRRPRPADGPPRRRPTTRRRRRLPDQARRPARSASSTRGRYKLANRIFFGLKVRDVDCACKLFRREALEGVRVESGGAFFSAELLIKIQARGPHRGRGRHPALPADGRLADRRQAVGDLARRQGLLGPAAADVGEPGAGAPARPADPGRLTRTRPATASSSTGPPRWSPSGPASSRTRGRSSSRVWSSDLAGRLGSTTLRRRVAVAPASSPSSASSIVVVLVGHRPRAVEDSDERRRRRTASAIASEGRASISCRSPSRLSTRRAWIRLVGQVRDHDPLDADVQRRRAPSRTGRGSAGARASGPGASSRSRSPPTARPRPSAAARASTSRRTRTWRPVGMCTRTLSTIISISVPRSPSMAGIIPRGRRPRQARRRSPARPPARACGWRLSRNGSASSTPAMKPVDVGEERDPPVYARRRRSQPIPSIP